MTKNEFLSVFSNELIKKNVADASDIVSEYEQHFSFKMADGFSEEEICAKLGDPAVLAVQFECGTATPKPIVKKIALSVGMGFADIFVGVFFVFMIGWSIVMAVSAVSFLVVAIAMLFNAGENVISVGGINLIFIQIPNMPYICKAIFGLSLASLGVLVFDGCVYFNALVRQMMSSFGRIHKNVFASLDGKATLPPISANPKIAPKKRRIMRCIAYVSLILFLILFAAGMIASVISSGAFEFWHEWGWFGYGR